MNNELTFSENQQLTTEEKNKVESYKASIDLTQADQIINYGVGAQSRLTDFADSALANVRSCDMGEVGKLLTDLNIDLCKFDAATKKDKKILGLFKSLSRQVAYLQTEYSKVEKNIVRIEEELQKHVQTLMKDIYIFNRQYDENWNFFRELSLYIIAGKEKIKEVQEEVLPKMRLEAEQSNDDKLIQQYNDMEQQLSRFEKKVHDMKLTRMISVQLAPQIRLVQNNAMTMVDKIQSAILNTLPLWKNQMVLALGIAHAQQALEAQKKVTEATNALLKSNREMLKQSTKQIAVESERSIVDIETIKKANEDLITAMDDLVQAQTDGRKRRMEAEIELKAAENQLKKHLLEKRKN